jgi:hypothetical protein
MVNDVVPLATGEITTPLATPVTKEELLTQIQALTAKVNAL